jgi:hypothetical protein
MEFFFEDVGVRLDPASRLMFGSFDGSVVFAWSEDDEFWFVEMIQIAPTGSGRGHIGVTRHSGGFLGQLFRMLSPVLQEIFADDLLPLHRPRKTLEAAQ